ncbi:MAG: Ig-like domain-containing protein, partial [Candidatus Poribacteria bacterium]
MGQDENNPIQNKKSWFKANAKWLIIIAILVIIIIIGAIKTTISPIGAYAKVESFKPDGEVPQTTNFTIEFSQDMVLADKVGVQLDSAPVVFTPNITGKFRWTAPHILQFYPNVMLLPSTRYTAEILPKIGSEMGYYLKGKRKFNFYTKKFVVDNAYLSFKFSKPSDEIVPIIGTIEFNYPVELEAIKKHLSIAYKTGDKIPYQIITPQAGTIIQLETEPIAHANKTHTVQMVIDKELVPANGTEGLSENWTKNFDLKAGGDLKVEGVFPERQLEFGYIKIRFNAPVEAELAKQYIIVNPIGDLQQELNYQFASNFHYVELRGNFKSGSAYFVAIK